MTPSRKLSISRCLCCSAPTRDNYTVNSDIDVLVVCKNVAKNAYSKAKLAIGMRGIEPHIYSEHEYQAMHGTIEKMLQDSVTIYVEEGFTL